MLTEAEPKFRSEIEASDELAKSAMGKVKSKPGVLSRVLRVEWLGQTIASLCWIISVFCYGISSVGDGLQLAAATAWLIANIAAVLPSEKA